MKKLLLNIILFWGIVSSLNAQLAAGSIAPDWTLTDINGQSWHLYELTAQGKTVFIDVSATWCPPCFAYHNSHALEEVYALHGPTGTLSHDVMIFFIEGDNTTTIADLNGTGTNTQGNWIAGTPYPIINPTGTECSSFNSDYAINYFPTVYKVCPDNKITEVGTPNASGLINSINSCGFQTDVYPSGGPESLQCTELIDPTIEIKNNGQSILTSCDLTYEYDYNGLVAAYNWIGVLNAGQSALIQLPQQTFSIGSHTLAVTSSNPNFGLDNNNTNNGKVYTFNINTASSVNLPLTNTFTNSSFPYSNWVLENPDNGTTWQRTSTNGGSLKYDCYNYSASGELDAFILEPLDFSTCSTPTLNFNIAHARYSASYTEKLEVLVSADCGQTWTTKWLKAGSSLATAANTAAAFTPTSAQWRAECVDLSAYIGQSKVFVKFVATNDYGNNIYIDDINISNSVCALGISEAESSIGFSVYPNPTSDVLNVTFNAENDMYELALLDLQGRVIACQNIKGNNADQNIVIPITEIAKGSYILKLTSAGKTKTHNVLIK